MSPCVPVMLAESREEAWRKLAAEGLDLLVIGGGIVGSGIARDAAMRGVKVGLVDQHDFAFGTSSRSSRLLHGGLRYLAQGRIGLVHEASVEKKIIHEIAPHLAEPLPFVFPTYKANRDWILWQLKIGVKIYDLLCGGRNLGHSSWLSPSQVLTQVPALNRDGLQGGVRYYDGFTNDARLTIDTIRSAQAAGALVLNYCRFIQARPGWKCELHDLLADRTQGVQAKTVVNATGPWAQRVPHSEVKLRLTKGVHLVVDRERVPVTDTVVMTEGKRILFAIPWGKRTILGTTDTDYSDGIEAVRADTMDVGYILTITNQFFPGSQLRESDVISFWAGLRPLIASRSGKPSDVSRSHSIKTPEPGWWDVAGGKLTTYRLMAEQTMDQISAWLRRNGSNTGGQLCRTAKEPLLPQTAVQGISGILPPAISRALVEHHLRQEAAVHLDDVMIRRTSWHYYHPNAPEIAEQVADWMGALLGWSVEARRSELARYTEAVSGPPSDRNQMVTA
jgi:glycerol-3-phosphate dehydrogenase